MIRKLASGKYRLYSRKKNPKTGRRRNLGTFSTRGREARASRPVLQTALTPSRIGGRCRERPAHAKIITDIKPKLRTTLCLVMPQRMRVAERVELSF